MENCENLKGRLLELQGKSFTRGKQGGYKYSVHKVNFGMGKFYIYTQSQTFVRTETDLRAFLDTITVLDTDTLANTALLPENDKKTLKNDTMQELLIPEAQTALTATLANANSMSEALMKQFNVMSGNPTEEDYKKTEAMAKVANTMNSITQTQINLINLTRKRS